ncbi:MAG TPA: hypothetical protein VM925_07315 [Labilithrix sp.]|nr:hypothetical protein [Labilithrix sp.]
MPRIGAPELEDYPWFPARLRDAMTGFLRVASEVLRMSAVAEPLVREAMAAAGTRRIVDLCSGGGGPVLSLAKRLHAGSVGDVSVVLTDKFPNLGAFARAEKELPGIVSSRSESVDATAVPPNLDGVRTIFNALHHLPPDLARAVFADAAAKRQPILSFEFVERSAQGAALASLAFVGAPVLMPFVRPRRLDNFALTYLLPVLPVAIAWDGVASCLRSYSVEELREVVAPLERADYMFRVERRRVPWTMASVTCVVGMPVT